MKLTCDLIILLSAAAVILVSLFLATNPAKIGWRMLVLKFFAGVYVGLVLASAVELYLHATGQRHYELRDKQDGSRVWEVRR